MPLFFFFIIFLLDFLNTIFIKPVVNVFWHKTFKLLILWISFLCWKHLWLLFIINVFWCSVLSACVFWNIAIDCLLGLVKARACFTELVAVMPQSLTIENFNFLKSSLVHLHVELFSWRYLYFLCCCVLFLIDYIPQFNVVFCKHRIFLFSIRFWWVLVELVFLRIELFVCIFL